MPRPPFHVLLPFVLTIVGLLAPPAWLAAIPLSLRARRRTKHLNNPVYNNIIAASLGIAVVGLIQILVPLAKAVPVVHASRGTVHPRA